MSTTENNAEMETPRLLRRAEYWEQLYELFPGATVLDDLETHPADETAARWIIVRYAAVRGVASLLGDRIDERELRIERNVGLNHLRSVPMLDREAWSLRKMLEALRPQPQRQLAKYLVDAGEAAARRGHGRGAYAMFHVAYRLSLPRRWHAEGARAARGIERLAREGGAVYSPRLWRRRARVMERRASVA
jgi:hypothetical protein